MFNKHRLFSFEFVKLLVLVFLLSLKLFHELLLQICWYKFVVRELHRE